MSTLTKPILMIHTVTEELFKLPLHEFTLTFDDGLYSQYYYLDRLCEIDTDKIFFISSNIVCTGQQSSEFPQSNVAHDKAFGGNAEDFMTLEQMREILTRPRCYIGGHSHTHTNLKDRGLVEKLEHIKSDTELMIAWFDHNLGILPIRFCYPYNDDLGGLYPALLKRYGITRFYGRERIPA